MVRSFLGNGRKHYLRDGEVPVGHIDPARFETMARFLHDSGVLKSADGTALAWPGGVSDWYDQGWMTE